MAPLDDPAVLVLALALSLFVGTLMGIIGGGGGFVYVFMLIVVLGVEPATAIGTGLLLAALGAATAALSHWRQGNVDLGHARRLAAAGVVAALAGGAVTTQIPEDVLRWLVIVLFVVLGVQPLLSGRGDRQGAPATRARRGAPEALGVGAVVGLGVGTFGISGGAPLSAYFAGREGLRGAIAVGTAMLVIVPMSLAGAVAHLSFGSVSAAWFAVLGLGAASGSWLGAGLTRRIDERVLAITLGMLSLATSVGLAVGV